VCGREDIKMTNKTNEQKGIGDAIQDFLRYRENDLPGIRESLKEGQNMRGTVKSFLEDKTELPENSDVYAGIKITPGRVNYRAAAEELSKKIKMTPQQYELFLNDFRKPGKKLVCGRIDPQMQLWPEDYEFITPKSVVAE